MSGIAIWKEYQVQKRKFRMSTVVEHTCFASCGWNKRIATLGRWSNSSLAEVVEGFEEVWWVTRWVSERGLQFNKLFGKAIHWQGGFASVLQEAPQILNDLWTEWENCNLLSRAVSKKCRWYLFEWQPTLSKCSEIISGFQIEHFEKKPLNSRKECHTRKSYFLCIAVFLSNIMSISM